MTAWNRPSKDLEEILENIVVRYPCDVKKMFGSTVYFVNNNMFAGVHQDKVFIRVPLAEKESIRERYHGLGNFEPLQGRVMREYLTLPGELARDDGLLEEILEISFSYVSAMPPKRE